MAITIRALEPLRKRLENQSAVELSAGKAGTVGAMIDVLQSLYPGVKELLLNEQGSVRGNVNIFVNDENIRFLQEQQTPLLDGDEVCIVPASAGG